jgi:alcohol dehydrogenase
MKAWRLERLGGALTLKDVPIPETRAGSVLVRVEASFYDPPAGAFTIGTNGVGVVEAVGRDVWHLEPGQRVVISPRVYPLVALPDAMEAAATAGRLRCSH